jgi:flagellar motor switch protein FliN/FliY
VRTAAKWVVESWAQELKTVLQFLTAEDWNITVEEKEFDTGGSPFWWTQDFSSIRGASISIGAPPLAWSELGARVLQAAGVELIEQSSARSTYLEAMQQSTSALARCLTARAGTQVDASTGRDQPPDGAGRPFGIIITSGALQLSPLVVVVSEELCSALEPPTHQETRLVETKEIKDTATPASSSRTMSVLLDVQMPVSISFGRTSMPLKEIMKLTTGSAVELDRKPDDDVEVIVNNCVIARGEVVVVDGNYGVKITEIISRDQRMALRTGGR